MHVILRREEQVDKTDRATYDICFDDMDSGVQCEISADGQAFGSSSLIGPCILLQCGLIMFEPFFSGGSGEATPQKEHLLLLEPCSNGLPA